MKGERRQRRVATGTAAANNQPRAVRAPRIRQMARAVDAILDVRYPPTFLQQFPVGTSKAGTTPIVHIEHGEAAAGPILQRQTQCGGGGAGRAAMTDDDQRWLLMVGAAEIRIARRIVKGVCQGAVTSGKCDGLRYANKIFAEGCWRRFAQRHAGAIGAVHQGDNRGARGGAADDQSLVAVHGDGLNIREGGVDGL